MAVTGLVVKTPPDKTQYVATELLDLTGLVVTIVDDVAGETDVELADFVANDLTTVPAEGDAVTTDNITVEIFYNAGELDETSALTTIFVSTPGVYFGNIPSALRAGGGYVRWREGQKFAADVYVKVPNDPSQEVTWSTSDDTVLTVSDEGVIQAVSTGLATITATSVADPTLHRDVNINVITLNEHITGAQVHALIASMDSETQQRFIEEQVKRMITIEDNTDNLYTAQLALVCSVI